MNHSTVGGGGEGGRYSNSEGEEPKHLLFFFKHMVWKVIIYRHSRRRQNEPEQNAKNKDTSLVGNGHSIT